MVLSRPCECTGHAACSTLNAEPDRVPMIALLICAAGCLLSCWPCCCGTAKRHALAPKLSEHLRRRAVPKPTPAHTDAVPHSCAHALRPLRWQRLRLRAPMAPSATLRSLSCAACGGADLGCHVLSVAPERAVPLDVAWSPQPASIGQSVARRQEREKERAVCVRRLGLGCSGCTESSGSMARARRRL